MKETESTTKTRQEEHREREDGAVKSEYNRKPDREVKIRKQ